VPNEDWGRSEKVWLPGKPNEDWGRSEKVWLPAGPEPDSRKAGPEDL